MLAVTGRAACACSGQPLSTSAPRCARAKGGAGTRTRSRSSDKVILNRGGDAAGSPARGGWQPCRQRADHPVCSHTRAACPDRDLVVITCKRWRVLCHIGAAPGWPFSYVSSGRVARGIGPADPTPGPVIELRESGQLQSAKHQDSRQSQAKRPRGASPGRQMIFSETSSTRAPRLPGDVRQYLRVCPDAPLRRK
jgi:hypothetical protein